MSHAQQAELACAGGISWIQFRSKKLSGAQYYAEALAVKDVCLQYAATFIINDRVEMAKMLSADGVHLGLKDMPIEDARTILGPNAIIGGTANTINQVQVIDSSSANYIGLGPFRETMTKKNLSPTLGVMGIQKITRTGVSLPIIAIGGIQLADLTALSETGVHGIAVASGITSSKDPKQRAQDFCEKLKLEYA